MRNSQSPPGRAYRLRHGGNVEHKEVVPRDKALRRSDGDAQIQGIRVGEQLDRG